jgi:hypothetical protein
LNFSTSSPIALIRYTLYGARRSVIEYLTR